MIKLKMGIRRKIRGTMNAVKKYAVLKVILPAFFAVCKRKPLDEKLVVFADLRDRAMHENFVGLYEMCQKHGYRCVWISGPSSGENISLKQRIINRIRFHLDFVRLYAQCRVLFLVEYFPMADVLKPRKETDVIQLWHGCGAMKVMGYAARGKKWGSSEKQWKTYPMHQYYKMASVSSEDVIPCYEKAFEVKPGVVKALGMPRTDIYFDEEFVSSCREKICKLFPEIGNRKIILFAPTFRGNSVKKSKYDIAIDYTKLKAELEDEYVLLTKFHPLMAAQGLSEEMRNRCEGFVFDVTWLLTPEDALCSADILVGDYSSIMFEYMLLNRPMISYIPDLDNYISDRGFFFPYEETMPGPYVWNEDDLLEKIKTVDVWYDENRTKKYCQKFMSACDGHSTERIFNEVFGVNQEMK